MSKRVLAGIVVLFFIGATAFHVFGASNVKAYGNINFGESRSIVKRKVNQNPDIEASFNIDWEDNIYFSEIVIGQYTYDLNFHFYKDELYRVVVSSPKRTADYFDTFVKSSRDKLVELIEPQYGRPSWENDISFFDVKSGYTTWSHVWKPEKTGEEKTIKIGINSYKAEYSAKIYIEYLPLVRKKQQAEEKREKESTEDQSENF